MKFPLQLSIAGLYHHYKRNMPNTMMGYIKAEPENAYDMNAIGIYNDEFGLIGYISKEDTSLVRAWSGMLKPELKCSISLSVEPKYDRYFGSVCIFDTPMEAERKGPFCGKRIYLCKSWFGVYGLEQVIEGYGAEVCNRLSKSIDYVIYSEELTDVVKNKVGVEGYNFETLTLAQFMQKAIPEDLRNPRIYGKVVTPSSYSDSALDDYLRNYILSVGGVFRKSYNKAETEVVVLKSDSPNQISAKATKDGKDIIRCSELIPQIVDAISAPSTPAVKVEPTRKRTSNSKASNNDDQNGAVGCVITILVIAFVIAFAIL